MIAPKRNRAPKIFSWGRACAGDQSISTPKAEELAGFPSVPLQAGERHARSRGATIVEIRAT